MYRFSPASERFPTRSLTATDFLNHSMASGNHPRKLEVSPSLDFHGTGID